MDGDGLAAAVEHIRREYEISLGFAGELCEVVLRLRGGREIPLPVPRNGGGPAEGLTPTQAAIVAVLRAAPGPLKTVTIAAKARLAPTNHFRAALLQLQKIGLVTKVSARGEPPRYQLAA